jgi:flagellar basal body-associated protein FliL
MGQIVQPTNSKKILLVIITITIAAVLIIGGFFIYKKYYQKAPATEQPQTLGGQIYEQIQNPAEKIPETNPFKAKTNPFEEAKTNPFKDVYKNPFGE